MRPKAARLAWAVAAATALAACTPSPTAQKPAASTAVAAETPAVPISDAPAAAASSAPDSASPPAAAPAASQVSAEDLIRGDKALAARDRRMHAMYENALVRDPTGEVRRQQAAALAARNRCQTVDCLQAWYSRREAALKEWQGN